MHIVEGATPIARADRSEIAAFVMGLEHVARAGRSSPRRSQDARVEAAIEQSRASFLSAMTHNLRTPLATIKTALSGLRRGGGDLEPGVGDRAARHRVRRVRPPRAAGEQGARAQPDPRRRASSPSPSRSTSPRRPRARCSGSGCSPRIARSRSTRPPDLPLVSADPALLDVVLVNVLENALRYAPESPIEVRGRRAGSTVRIEVVDHGPGVTDRRPRRGCSTSSCGIEPDAVTPGTGIGLTIAKAFVEAQRGRDRRSRRLPAEAPPS